MSKALKASVLQMHRNIYQHVRTGNVCDNMIDDGFKESGGDTVDEGKSD